MTIDELICKLREEAASKDCDGYYNSASVRDLLERAADEIQRLRCNARTEPPK